MPIVGLAEVLVQPVFSGSQRAISKEIGPAAQSAGKSTGKSMGKSMAKGFSQETASFEAAVAKTGDAVTKAQEKVAKASGKVETAMDAQAKATNGLQLAEQKLLEAQNKRQPTQSQILASTNRVNEAQEKLEATVRAVADAEDNLTKANRKLESSNDSLAQSQEKASDATAAQVEAAEELRVAEEKLNKAQNRKVLQHKNIAKLTEQVTAAQAKLKETTKESTAVNKELAAATKKVEANTKALSAAHTKAENATAAHTKAVNGLEVAQQKLNEVQNSGGASQSELLSLTNKVEEARTRLERVTHDVTEANGTLETSQNDVARAEKQQAKATADLNSHLRVMAVEAQKAGTAIGKTKQAFKNAFRGRPLGEFRKTVVSDVGDISKSLDHMAESVENDGTRGGRAFTRFMGVASVALTGILPLLGSVTGGFLATAGAVTTLAGSLQQLGGVAALLPAGLIGGAAVAGTLRAATSGVGEALTAGAESKDQLAKIDDREAIKLGQVKGSGKDAKAERKRIRQNAAEQRKQVQAGVDRALGGLTGSAQTAVKALLDVYKRLGAVQNLAQQNFFKGFADPLRTLADTVLPQLKTGVGEIASVLGEGAQELMRSLNAELGQGVLQELLSGVAKTLRILVQAIDPLVQAFITLGQVGMKYFPDLARFIREMAQDFNVFIQLAAADGRLNAWIDMGIQGFRDLWSIIKSTASIFSAWNDAARAGGVAVTLNDVAKALNRVEAVMEGPVFQKTMSTIFAGAAGSMRGLARGAQMVGDAFVRGAPALAEFLRLSGEIVGLFVGGVAQALSNPEFGAGLTNFLRNVKAGLEVVVPLLPGLTSAFGRLLTALGPIARELGPTLVRVFTLFATAVADLVTFIEPFLLALVESEAAMAILIGAFIATAAASAILTAASNVVKVAMGAAKVATVAWTIAIYAVKAPMAIASVAMGLFTLAFRTNTRAIATNKIAVKAYRVGLAIWTGITKAAAAVMWVFSTALKAVILTKRILIALTKRATYTMIASTVAQKAARAALLLWTGALKAAAVAQRVLNLAMRANPLGIIITAVAALTGALIWFFTQTKLGKAIWEDVWGYITNAVKSLGEIGKDIFMGILNGLTGGNAQVAIDAVVHFFNKIVNWIKNFLGIASPSKLFAEIGGDIMAGLAAGIQGAVVVIKAIFKGIVWVITNILVPAVKWLWHNIIKPAFTGIGKLAVWLWKNAIQPAFKGIVWFINNILVPVIGFLWRNVVKRYFQLMGATAKWLWNNAIKPAFKAIGWFIKNVLGPVISWIWNKVVKPYFRNIGKLATWLWKNAIKPAFKGIVWFIEKVLVPVIKWWWNNIVKPYFTFIGDLATWLWRNAIKPAFKGIWNFIKDVLVPIIKFLWNKGVKPVFSWIGDKIDTVWNDWIKPAFNAMVDAVKNIPGAFEDAKDGIGKAWNKLIALAKKPVDFVVDTVLNEGIIDAFNAIPGVDIPDIPWPPKGWRKGGYTGDGHPDEWAGGVHKGEFVMPAEATAAIGKDNLQDMMHAAVRGKQEHPVVGNAIVGGSGGGYLRPARNQFSAAGEMNVGRQAGWYIDEAVKAWQNVTDLNVKAGGGYPHVNTFSGPLAGYPVAMTRWGGGGTSIQFDNNKGAGMGKALKRGIAAHEIGHALGLPHVSHRNSIMDPMMADNLWPNAFDRNLLRGLYGKGSGKIFGPGELEAENPFIGMVDVMTAKLNDAFPDGGMLINAVSGIMKEGIQQVTAVVEAIKAGLDVGPLGGLIDTLTGWFGAGSPEVLDRDTGGIIPPGISYIRNRTGQDELALNPRQIQDVQDLYQMVNSRQAGGGGDQYYVQMPQEASVGDLVDAVDFQKRRSDRGGVQ